MDVRGYYKIVFYKKGYILINTKYKINKDNNLQGILKLLKSKQRGGLHG